MCNILKYADLNKNYEEISVLTGFDVSLVKETLNKKGIYIWDTSYKFEQYVLRDLLKYGLTVSATAKKWSTAEYRIIDIVMKNVKSFHDPIIKMHDNLQMTPQAISKRLSIPIKTIKKIIETKEEINSKN